MIYLEFCSIHELYMDTTQTGLHEPGLIKPGLVRGPKHFFRPKRSELILHLSSQLNQV